ncbi:MAG: type II toxin-antitoxin system HipA family toxin [Myxococcales bacterium]|nr:type II toxin-antitoxin system HipA family toxin [Myxococcales bacterium]
MGKQRIIEVAADWAGLRGPVLMGQLTATPSRGKEIFAFEYDKAWLSTSARRELDPSLALYRGPQYPAKDRENFGVFLDSCPDRWGRVLMRRREAQLARVEGRQERHLLESDYLLGVHDGHRMGAIRFRVNGRFLDDNDELASPPWTSLRDLEHASLELEREGAENDPDYGRWLRMLIAPGGSLGGARPKASVRDEGDALWIAKFPSRHDDDDIGAWEMVVHELAASSGLVVPDAQLRRFGKGSGGRSAHHTFLSRRFDRSVRGGRLHFASAMTLLGRVDGQNADDGVSYLDLADLLIRLGSNTSTDLEQLFRRIIFFVCVSNTDDHLRNHGFMLTPTGWALAPAYDMNPDPDGAGLKLNISETDNAQDLDLAISVASAFRVKPRRAEELVDEITFAVRKWREVAAANGISRMAQDRMRRAFRVVES